LLVAVQSPVHPAPTCGAPAATVTVVSASQPPAPVQVAWPVLFGALVSLVAVVLAQPAESVEEPPTWQPELAVVEALVTCAPGADAREVPSVICA
jgi:hypothetical protein